MAVVVVIASSRSRVAGPEVSHFDKVAHFCVYGLIASLVCRMRPGWRWALGAVAITSLFGFTDEWHQSHTPGREADFGDWIADTLGAALAVALYAGWRRYRELLEFPLWRWGGRPDCAPTVSAPAAER